MSKTTTARIEFSKAWLRRGLIQLHGVQATWPQEVQDRYHRDLGFLYDFLTDLDFETITNKDLQ